MRHISPALATTHSRRQVLTWGAGASLLAVGGFARPTLANQATPGAATGTFLDAATVHEIAISFDQATYEAMIETLSSTGDKEWIEATVTIDGASYEKAGIRLKGNSSLGMLGGPPRGDGDPPLLATPASGADGVQVQQDVPDGEKGFVDVTGESGNSATAETPELLPWLVKLDRNVDGQNHQGITELVIRSNMSATSLNEAVALDLLDLAGLASQRAALTRFRANDREPALRLAIQHPDDTWMLAHFPNGGFLYKAEAGGTWDYQGDDPKAYKDSFDLEAGKTGDDSADMQPLFDFLKFINESDDAAFENELPSHLDVDGFATYLAMMDLLSNFDDIRGPGNNAYLHVDPDATQMVVVPWDMNLAFGGGMRMGNDGGTRPDFEDLPDDASVWIDGTPVAEGEEDGPVIRMEGPDGESRFDQNILLKRWDTVTTFTDRVTAAHDRLHTDLYTSGTAHEVLVRWVGVLNTQAADMVDANTVATEAAAIEEILHKQA